MKLFQSDVREYRVSLLYEIRKSGVAVVDKEFPNAIMASAALTSSLGYGLACDFLFEHNVPKESLIWHLNHSGYPANHRSGL